MKFAVLCYIFKDDHVLMLHRVKKKQDIHEGKWVGLGGKVEKGESPEDTVVREIKEEANIEIKNLKWHGVLTEPAFKNDEDWYVFVYSATYDSGEWENCLEGNLAWIHKNEIQNLPQWEGDLFLWEWCQENRFFSAKFEYINGKLQKNEVKFYDK